MKFKRPRGAPDLSEYRKRYPLTVTHFGALANREAWLDRIWQQDVGWQQAMERDGKAQEAIVRGAPPANLSVEGEFEIIYAGGALGLLHAAVMSSCYKRRVLVFDAEVVGSAERDWNISDDELRGFERARLFTRDEVQSAISNRYRSSFVKFYDAASRVKAPPLWMDGVLDVAADAHKLLALAAAKLEASETGSALLSGLRFVRCYVQPERVTVEVEDVRTKKRSLFSARLFVDATATNSRVARQLNDGRAITHICPTVGTVSRGLSRGNQPDQVDFNVGEILVSKEDVRDHRQLIWEGFAGSRERDEYATYLFFYDAVDSPADKSLLALFERYFEQLPGYKRAGAQWRVMKPVFGYAPAFHQRSLRSRRKRTTEDHVLLVGEAAGLSSPLTFGGIGSHVRTLARLTHLTDLALRADLLDAASLSEINSEEPRVAQMSGLAEFLRPTPKSAPATVNETLNAVMAALHSLDERVRRELFQDRLSFNALKRLLSRTAKLYPRIFQRVREHFGARGAFWWLANMTAAAFSERRSKKALLRDDEGQSEDAAREFARYVAIYKNQHGVDSQ
ncbi:MAG: lycopene cyclase CruA [Acidobacteriota bacterium]|nr:lycopene cyclase CruA [Acidobacteriota bacterium]